MRVIVLSLLIAISSQAKTIHLRFLVQSGGQSVYYRDQYTVDPKLEVWRFMDRVTSDYRLERNRYAIAQETLDGLQALNPRSPLSDYGAEADAAILLHIVPKKDAEAAPAPVEQDAANP